MRPLHFLEDSHAGVAPLLALCAIPLLGAAGAAVDYSRANSARAAMQGALDATAVMLAKDAQPSQQSAQSYFSGNFGSPEIPDVQVTLTASDVPSGKSLALTASGAIATRMLGMLGFSTIPLSVKSTIVTWADGMGCVLSLNRSASGATTAQGSTTVTLNGCSLYDNSNSSTALTAGGSARIEALAVGVVGGISGADNITAQQGIKTSIGPVPDPYSTALFPDFAGCKENDFKAKTTITISPGVYCGGMAINAGANVTLSPGIYYLDGGDLSINGGATFTGNGVTLVFTKKTSGSWATATINGNAIVNLTPPNYGPTAGITVFGDRAIPLGTTFKFNGGSTQYIGGAIYIPTGSISFSGGAGTSSNCTQVIGDTVNFVGNSGLAINCSNYHTKPFGQTIIKIVS